MLIRERESTRKANEQWIPFRRGLAERNLNADKFISRAAGPEREYDLDVPMCRCFIADYSGAPLLELI